MNSTADTQDDVFAFLADPTTHGGAAVKRFDTHAAAVFLAGDRVFKVKRAVKFPFLDFSTLDRRKAACESEIAVNRRFAPELYRGVVAITRGKDGQLALGGDGETVEWAVEMRRFDETQTLDRIAEAGAIGADLADALGRAIAAAHAHAPAVESAPWIEALGAYIDEHITVFSGAPAMFAASDVAALAPAWRAAYARIRPLIEERGRRGLVRRIHGDLHLGNIVCIDGRPVLFDAIEFSDLIASGDVLYDLAFLLMDLWERGQQDAASIAFNRYLIETRRDEDLDALAALPFYLSMRAAIRAKVMAERQEQAPDDASTARSAQRYFAFACEMMHARRPALITVGGLSGTGKTQLARSLASEQAPCPGAVVLRSDVERKAQSGHDEFAALPAGAYTPAATLRVYATILDKARRLLAAGHSAILDAVFAAPQERAGAEQSARVLGAPFRGLFLTADLATRLARVGGRKGDASDADAAVVEQQERYDIGALAWTRIDAAGTPAHTLEQARIAIARA